MQVANLKDVTAEDASSMPIFIGGKVTIQKPIDPKNVEDINFGLVAFNPGSRTKKHTHNKEQILIVTEGKGIVATDEKEYIATPGMVFYIPKGEIHWHGATKTTSFKHLSIISPIADAIMKE
jgi:quercetin dioxygenase-like cupin family protein